MWSALNATAVSGGSDAGEGLFQNLFEALAAATTGTAPITVASSGSAAGIKAESGDSRKAAEPSSGNQSNAAISPEQQASLPSPSPLGWLLNSMTMPTSSGDSGSAPSDVQPSLSVLERQASTDDSGISALNASPAANANLLPLSVPIPPFAFSDQTSSGAASDLRQPANQQQSVGSAVAPSANSVPTTPMQTAFSLLLHLTQKQQTQPAASDEGPAPTEQISEQPSSVASTSPIQAPAQNSGVQQAATAAASVDVGTRNTPVNAANASTESSPTATTPANTAESPVPSAPTKTEPAASNTNNKPNQDQSDERQPVTTVIDTTAATPVANKFENVASVAPSSARPATEYVAPQHADSATQANGSLTDIRVQVDGTANQHVNVRVVQEGDGVRVTVRSNDENLTQTLQDRLPDLTTKLEQHHYQADVAVPQRSAPSTSSDTGSGTNLQQESSGRQQSSGGQGNPQNRQNRQQQTPEEEVFASLLGIRR